MRTDCSKNWTYFFLHVRDRNRNYAKKFILNVFAFMDRNLLKIEKNVK